MSCPVKVRTRIEHITPEEEALCAEVGREWSAIARSTAPADRAKAEEGIHRAYELSHHAPLPEYLCVKCETPFTGAELAARYPGLRLVCVQREGATVLPKPVTCSNCAGAQPLYRGIQWVRSPDEAVVLAAQLAGGSPAAHLAGFFYGQHAAGWLSFYDAWGRLGIDVHELEGLLQVARHAGWWLPFDTMSIVCERPTLLALDPETHRLHAETGPAVFFRDGYALYAIRGVTVPARLIMDPDSLTWQDIDAEDNLEVRRVMLQRFGAQRYIQASGAKRVHRDSYGELYVKECPGDEPVVMVRVVNATPENVPPGSWHWDKVEGARRTRVTDDETLRILAWTYFETGQSPPGYEWRCDVAEKLVYKEYWIRVPPTMTTAHAAVAWTFGKTPKTYAPKVQT